MEPYLPSQLPLDDFDYKRLFSRIGPANAALAEYAGLLRGIVNPAVMLSPLTQREAVLSSRIEGTQATVDEVLEYEAGLPFGDEKVKDIQEVLNYRRALALASDAIKAQPLSLSLMRQMHGVLMDSVRGADKSPGEFRKTQNLIGKPGATQETASFVPPNPMQLTDHLEAFARYLLADDVDVLIQTAIVHAQFELLHPFSDGNGRIGRLLIPLFLMQKGALSQPMFYLSEYLEAHRETYYAKLRGISQEGDWTGWLEFFLTAITEQAKENSHRVIKIQELYEAMKQRITDLTQSKYALQILDTLFDQPIFKSSDFIERSGIPKNSAIPFLRALRKEKILHPIREASGSRPAILAFRELLNCTEGRKII
jgi:Fic family protein